MQRLDHKDDIEIETQQQDEIDIDTNSADESEHRLKHHAHETQGTEGTTRNEIEHQDAFEYNMKANITKQVELNRMVKAKLKLN
jgi:hypothetical protein